MKIKEECCEIYRNTHDHSPLFFSGYSTIGPKTMPCDRFDYNTAISDAWKEQTLVNVVKPRCADMPFFVEAASVVSE